MVLIKSGAQYKFLQLLTKAYLHMIEGFTIGNCIANPTVYTDCNDTSTVIYDLPTLPTLSGLALPGDNAETWSYSDYSQITFHGFSNASFSSIASRLINSTTSTLLGACATDARCSTAFDAFSNVDDALSVAKALATTNVNTIQSVLAKSPKKTWIPSTNYGYFTSMYTRSASASDEVYGMHDAIVQGIAAGTVNATQYLQQQKLSLMLYGGAAMYESLIHHAAMGSFAWDANQIQSNINLTGTQVYTHISDGDLDTRTLHLETKSPLATTNYTNKWQLWRDEARGVKLSNKDQIIAEMKQKWRKNNINSGLSSTAERSTQKCEPPSETKDGISFLDAVGKACAAESIFEAYFSIGKAFNTAAGAFATAGLKAWGGAARTSAGVVMSTVVGLCSTNANGFPCYPGATVWTVAQDIGLITQVLADVAVFDSPVGAYLMTINLACALASSVASDFQQDLDCCAQDCTSPSCQSSANGCTQGVGIC